VLYARQWALRLSEVHYESVSTSGLLLLYRMGSLKPSGPHFVMGYGPYYYMYALGWLKHVWAVFGSEMSRKNLSEVNV